VFVLVSIFVLCVAAAAALGVVGYSRRWSLPRGGPSELGRVLAQRHGAAPAAAGILVGGSIAAFVLSVPIGFLAKALEGPLDKPAFRFAAARVHGGKFTALNEKLTVFGNNGEVQLLCLIAVILLACAFGRRSWWVPVGLVVLMFYIERYAQRFLAKIVHRGHPPATLGTYPSGGVARIVSVYGLVLLLTLVLLPALSRAWRAGLFTALGVAATVEAYTRWYLAKHWLTDALGGLTFGYLLLGVGAATVAALTSGYGPGPARPAGHAIEARCPQPAKQASTVGRRV
jgi:hypothetical protein